MKPTTVKTPFQGETTSPDIGSLAGRILAGGIHDDDVVEFPARMKNKFGKEKPTSVRITGAEMKAMASSLVNQMANHSEER
jgi:hypothetical protein